MLFLVVPIEYSIMESQTWRWCCLHQWSKYTFNWEFFSFLLYMFFKMYNWVIFVGEKNLQMVNLSSSDYSDCIFLILCLFLQPAQVGIYCPKLFVTGIFNTFGQCFLNAITWNSKLLKIMKYRNHTSRDVQLIWQAAWPFDQGEVTFLPFYSQDLICNSPYCLLYNSNDISLEILVLDQLIIL